MGAFFVCLIFHFEFTQKMILYQRSYFAVYYADYYLYSLVDRFLAKIAFFVIINLY